MLQQIQPPQEVDHKKSVDRELGALDRGLVLLYKHRRCSHSWTQYYGFSVARPDAVSSQGWRECSGSPEQWEMNALTTARKLWRLSYWTRTQLLQLAANDPDRVWCAPSIKFLHRCNVHNTNISRTSGYWCSTKYHFQGQCFYLLSKKPLSSEAKLLSRANF
jgi:hypothetical protein